MIYTDGLQLVSNAPITSVDIGNAYAEENKIPSVQAELIPTGDIVNR